MSNTIRAMLSISLVFAVVGILWAYASERALSRMPFVPHIDHPTPIFTLSDPSGHQPIAVVAPWSDGDMFDFSAGNS
jgi:hypothetical protein